MRRTRLALALPVLLPFVGVALVRGGEEPKPVAPAPAAPAEPVVPGAPKPATQEPRPATPRPDEAKAGGIAWLTDYEAAKVQAAEQKKGLFVYLTPAWFT